GGVIVLVLELRTFENVYALCVHLKEVAMLNTSRSPDRISDDDFVEYIGKLMEISQNDEMFFKPEGYAKTADNVIRKARLNLIFNALKKYNPNNYGDVEVRE
ncbi:MAG: hypothetical protein FWG36_02090, partial [Oscillospiraceae bacterium]|nr:hypothetical protein [Oscillospiraceae bacterium]